MILVLGASGEVGLDFGTSEDCLTVKSLPKGRKLTILYST